MLKKKERFFSAGRIFMGHRTRAVTANRDGAFIANRGRKLAANRIGAFIANRGRKLAANRDGAFIANRKTGRAMRLLNTIAA